MVNTTSPQPDRIQRYTVFFITAALILTIVTGLKPAAPAPTVAITQPSPIVLIITATPALAPVVEQPVVEVVPTAIPATAEPPTAEPVVYVEQPVVVEQPIVEAAAPAVVEAAPTPAVQILSAPIGEHGQRPSNRPGPGDRKKAAP